MLWSFIAVCLSAWLSVDASYRGPTWQRWVFKPLTLLLLLLLAWQAPMFDAISYLVLAGLCASLLGDALTLLPRQRLMYPLGIVNQLPAVQLQLLQSAKIIEVTMTCFFKIRKCILICALTVHRHIPSSSTYPLHIAAAFWKCADGWRDLPVYPVQ